MSIDRSTTASPDAGFDAAREQLESMVGWLESGGAAEVTHAEIETRLDIDGRAILRQLFQGHLDLRALREERRSEVTGSAGEARSHVRSTERSLTTVFGPVRVGRLRYGGRGLLSLFPADLALNLPQEEYSHGLRVRAAELASTVSFEEPVRTIDAHTGGHVPARQTQELVRRAALDFDAFYAAGIASGPEDTQDVLVLTLDGKGVAMRPDHLREATRRAAEKRARAARDGPDDGSDTRRPHRDRMATVAAVYTVARHLRSADDIMHELRPVRAAAKASRPRARAKRVWASVEKDARVVTREVFDEAERRDPEHRRTWVVVVDGDRNQIRNIRREASRRGIEIVLVLDFIHALGYLWKAAWSFFEHGDPEAGKWVRERARRLLEGRSSDVAGGIRRSATKRGLPAARRKGADECANYLIAKRKMLHYETYLPQGLPIASGVIEGACRHLVEDRLGITGARWTVPGAEAVLRLRALRSSGDFQEYWRFHLAQERRRNHDSRYAEGFAAVAA
jgi:hypothetical protein